MPTENHAKVRKLLKDGRAKCVKRTPFTIQLNYDCPEGTQPVTLGVDAGSKHIGLSATTEDKELYAAEVELRSDITKNIATRREFRSARRNRKTRYRKARFNNRVKAKRKGWLAPSVRAKVDSHIKVIADVHKILPVNEIVIEVAQFDIQKIKSPEIEGEGYQQGEQLGFWNVREYVFYRDGHTCQCCKGMSKDPVLNVHHIESRKTGGDAPNNLVTLCETCHKKYHRGEIELPKGIRRTASFRDAAFMGIMRWTCYNRLREMYPNVRMTYGYITKNTRIRAGLEKSHTVDARCISGHPNAGPAKEIFYMRKVRRHNRQIHKATIAKGGVRKRNQATYEVKGFRLFDKVKAKGREWYIHGRRTKGSFVLKTIQSEKLEIAPRKIRLLEHQNTYITERRMALLPSL